MPTKGLHRRRVVPVLVVGIAAVVLAAGVGVRALSGDPSPAPARSASGSRLLTPAETRSWGGSTYVRFETGPLGEARISSARILLDHGAVGGGSSVEVHRTAAEWDLPGAKEASVVALDLSDAVPTTSATSTGPDLSLRLQDLEGFVAGQALSYRLTLGGAAVTAPDELRPRLLVEVVADRTRAPAARPVYAHYFPPYPLSYDDQPPDDDYYARNLLEPDGEQGRHAAYGGLLRDRPLGRAPRRKADFALMDLRTEVHQAQRAALDGFTLDLLSTSGRNWEASLDLMRAAQEVGDFEVVPNVDATAPFGAAAPAEVARKLAELYAFSSAARAGRDLRLASFAAERNPPAWWGEVMRLLETSYGIRTTFTAVFLDASQAHMSAYAPVADGFGAWGERTAAAVESGPDLAARAHEMGRTWMAPVAVQDARPRNGLYAEAGNTETLRAMWTRARDDGADQVQVVTWNDYSESTSIAPSQAHGEVFADLTAFYADWYRTGRLPAIATDHLYLTHRRHPVAAVASTATEAMLPTLGGATTRPRDTVEALVLLRLPAEVRVTTSSGTTRRSFPAGVHVVTVPLATGTISAAVERAGRPVVEVRSPHEVTSTPVVLDLQYWAVGR